MPTGVLLSGGLDSAVLLAEEAACDEVQPIYVSVGFPWEAAEREALRLFFDAFTRPTIRPLAALTVDMTDVYPAVHWARAGQAPAYHTPDEDVYIPGRNVVLLGKAGVFCAMAGLDRLVIGTLDHNPFPDATSAFREAMAQQFNLLSGHYAEFGWSEAEFQQKLAGTPIYRIGHERWLRNIAVGLGNATGSPAVIAALQARADHPSPLVREHVAWALQRHGG